MRAEGAGAGVWEGLEPGRGDLESPRESEREGSLSSLAAEVVLDHGEDWGVYWKREIRGERWSWAGEGTQEGLGGFQKGGEL